MAVEYRGCKGVVIAPVLVDDNETGEGHGYVTGAVIPLAPVAEISKSVETSSETHSYDNTAQIVINSESGDTVTLTLAVPNDEVRAMIEGRTYDPVLKRFIESERTTQYFALGYIIGETGEGDDERYVWRHKGTFNIPEETAHTKDESTDANNLQYEYTGIYTKHIFENGKGTGKPGFAKSTSTLASDGLCTAEQFFAKVTTPDTVFIPPNAKAEKLSK